MIIEQQQILTTQNLAALYVGLDIRNALDEQLPAMAKQCFKWICKRQQMKIDDWHGRLIMLKNTAYAWRQLIFYLSMLSNQSATEFLSWSEDHFNAQAKVFKDQFRPVLQGLIYALEVGSLDTDLAKKLGIKRFLGWSNTRHWLLPTGSP